jgi:hypothetical protein
MSNDSLPGKGEKPNARSLDEMAVEDEPGASERDETPVQLNVRIPRYLRKALRHRKVETDEKIEDMVTEALSSYLDL